METISYKNILMWSWDISKMMIWKMNQIKLSQLGNACDKSNSNIILLWKYGKKSHQFIMLMAHQKNDHERIIDVYAIGLIAIKTCLTLLQKNGVILRFGIY